MPTADDQARNASELTLAAATERAMRVRKLYHQLEEQYHATAWSVEEDMLALSSDTGVLARLVMAAEGRWGIEGDVQTELRSKTAECLWWLLVISDRLGIDITREFDTFVEQLEARLSE